MTALLALAGVALLIPSARAGTITVNETCDLILGFRVGVVTDDQGAALPSQGIGDSINLEINLGSASQFYNASAGSSFTLPGLVVADLIAAYGSNWNTRTDLFWGVIGTTGRAYGSLTYSAGDTLASDATADGHAPAGTIWATRAEDTPGTQSTAWKRASSYSTQITVIEPLYSSGGPLSASASAASTDNSSTATLVGTATVGSWTSQENPSAGKSFKLNGLIDNTTNIPVDGFSVLDLYELKAGSGNGTLLGAFGLNSAGELTFSTDISTFAAVPEPSSMVLLALAGGLFAMRLRRQRLAATA